MASKRWNFSDSERAQLFSDIRTMLKQTELSGNEASIYRFSDGTEKSTHSFGIKQFDVGRNPKAKRFLARIGFRKREIDELSRQGSLPDRDKLNEKLRRHKKEVDDFTDLQIQHSISRLESLINRLDSANPAAAAAIRKDHDLQLALVDYDNQLGISDLGEKKPRENSLLAYLSGQAVHLKALKGGTLQLDPKATLTRNDIQNYIDHTFSGVKYPKPTGRREHDLTKVLKTISSEQSRLPRSGQPNPNNHRTGSGTQQPPAGQNRNVGQIPKSAGQAPTGANPYTLPAGKNSAVPYQAPSTTNPVKASSYPYPNERPNPFSPKDPTTWGQSAPSTGPSWMNDNALLRIPSASAGLSAPYSGGVQQPGFGTPTYLTFDPALLLRPNRLLEPMRPDNPFGAGPMGQEGQTDLRANNLLGPWPGRYLLWRRNPFYQDP